MGGQIKVPVHGTSLSPNGPITPAYQISQMKQDQLVKQMEEDRGRTGIPLEIDNGPDPSQSRSPEEQGPSER